MITYVLRMVNIELTYRSPLSPNISYQVLSLYTRHFSRILKHDQITYTMRGFRIRLRIGMDRMETWYQICEAY